MKIRLTNLIQYLKLSRIVHIHFSEKENDNMHAWYEPLYSDNGRLVGHNIKVYLGNPRQRPIESIVAHELIHAWQEENKVTDIHGKRFAMVAKRVAKKFALRKVYMPRIDTP